MVVRRISVKSLILSNLAHWLFLVAGLLAVTTVSYACITIADGGSDSGTILGRLSASTSFLGAILAANVIAPIPAGYIAAKLAKRAALLHGMLATSTYLLFAVYIAVWGPPPGDHDLHIPLWLDFATSFGVPLPALLGAHLWTLRARRRSVAVETPRDVQQSTSSAGPQSAAASSPSSGKSARSRRMGEAGVAAFIVLVLRILLPEHQRNWLVLIVFVALLLLIAFAFASKAIKKRRASIG